MKRRLCNLLATLSLVMCVATMVMWVRGLYRCDGYLVRLGERRTASIQSMPATFQFFHQTGASSGTFTPGWMVERRSFPMLSPRLGIAVQRGSIPTWENHQRITINFVCVVVSHFVTVPVTTILPAFWAVRALQARRQKQIGHCTVCGYDLRATPERCPECGTVVPAPAAGIITNPAQNSVDV